MQYELNACKVTMRVYRHKLYIHSSVPEGPAMSNEHVEATGQFIEYCCPKCGQICTEAEVQQGFCVECDACREIS